MVFVMFKHKGVSLTFFLLTISNFALSAPAVNTSIVSYQSYAKNLRVSGRLVNKAQQKLSFKIQGVVADILVDEGQRVKAGQLLAQLDKAEITAQVRQAKSVFDNSTKNLNRFERLYQDKVITQEQLQAAQTRQQVARSDMQIALFNQKHAEIRATSDGWILKRMIEKQEIISPNQTAFLISNEGSGWILRVGISDKDIVHIQQNDITVITLDAYPGQVLQGNVSEIAAAANNSSGLFEIEIRLKPVSLRLYSGFIAKANIQTSATRELAFIPIQSIVSANGKEAEVFVLNPQQQAEKRQVQLAFIKQGEAAISGGLDSGEVLISDGAAYIRPGTQITLMNP